MDRIDHGQAYSLPGGVYTNGAECFFSRCAVARSGITTTSRGRIWSGTAKKRRGVRIIAG